MSVSQKHSSHTTDGSNETCMIDLEAAAKPMKVSPQHVLFPSCLLHGFIIIFSLQMTFLSKCHYAVVAYRCVLQEDTSPTWHADAKQ